ncbi:MAG: HAD family phosphatase [Alphaproteobacteria bacterium]|jgi:HAD superfamily hydrolase (TIGR01509 family)|uniref:Haloacid dehalogenase superfamily, subfamily IA, variant 3 with third motif having DD or ED n=2 Tax=Celeribacter baekdonensis TaxID=875171 RepID=A0A1G7QT33_9RHOB|nr:HAD family phosphatase [Alphaproteobacteria bacterium]SDG01688.1 haloacid dehalogenase superfamily, subfamily IA, variant 3 with third motif having DD or ED [Celeribacter baekdonensis]MBU1280768.1 HAD family phosphatase [Alphaproteobacteria bacterium]MBU1575192.1 HAD family phosphatase [Alphaproteobacteria bacterium]MBU1829288.1 HAD family phosphatase [Alphaproteobacteria bacterium]
MQRKRAVIFDLDGCLVDSEPLSLEAIAIEMRALGVRDARAREIGDRFLGVAMPVIVDYVAKRLGGPVPEGFAQQVENRLLASYESKLFKIPGADTLLSGLQKQGTTMAIATGGSLRRMRTTLELAGLDHWFADTACSAEEVANGKPAPDLFLLALDRLGRNAADCLVLEDSPHGIRGANAAGIPAIGFVGGKHLDGKRDQHSAVLREAGAIEVFEELSSVERFIQSYTEDVTK